MSAAWLLFALKENKELAHPANRTGDGFSLSNLTPAMLGNKPICFENQVQVFKNRLAYFSRIALLIGSKSRSININQKRPVTVFLMDMHRGDCCSYDVESVFIVGGHLSEA